MPVPWARRSRTRLSVSTNQYTGRGPTKARTTVAGNIIVVVLADTLIRAERSLVDNGEVGFVLDLRKKLQMAMRNDLVAAIEKETGREVVAFISDNHVDPDMAVEIFVMRAEG